MSKSVRWFLVPVLCAALALMAFLGMNWLDLGKRLHETNALLDGSRASWEKTASEKEEIQDQLKVLKDDLREAKLSLDEAEERAVSLEGEITQLRDEIALLNEKLSPPD